jgi:hypothetical protein
MKTIGEKNSNPTVLFFHFFKNVIEIKGLKFYLVVPLTNNNADNHDLPIVRRLLGYR